MSGHRILIDPDDPEQVARLADAFCSARWSHQPGSEECDPLTRSSMKMALNAYRNPPKPAEPTGLGAVVEDRWGTPWVRCENVDREPHWYARNKMRHYADLDVVRVLSEGVTP